ncbi:MAG: gamma-glutamyltransferase family protein [Candidatus Kapaibacterium sp.]
MDVSDQSQINRFRAESTGGMVSSAHHLATDAGAEMLQEGGNAIDAAVATAFALGVCEPAASGIGGQTMLVFSDRSSETKIALDGSSRAPFRIVPGTLSEEERFYGHRATTVPSTPAVLAYANKRYGKLPLAKTLEPAIRIAREGFAFSDLQERLSKKAHERLSDRSGGRFFLKPDGEVFRDGEVLRQPVLASTLERIAAAGVEDFYHGEIAGAIVEDMKRNSGLIDFDDLAQIPWPIERTPLETTFGGNRVMTIGPPAAGRALMEILNVLDTFHKEKWDLNTPEGALIFAKADRRAQIDRHDQPFDPHYYPQVPGEKMLSKKHALNIAGSIRRRESVMPGETTHMSAADADGNMVGLTQSIERVYGSCEASPELGFLYNNYISTMESKDPINPHYLRPNVVPWASVAPTIVFEGDEPAVVLGSPGSERIVSAVAQVLERLHHQDPYDAVDSPRLHCSREGLVFMESGRMDPKIPDYIRQNGLEIRELEPYSFFLGCVQLVTRRNGKIIGVADPRRDGSAKGVNR